MTARKSTRPKKGGRAHDGALVLKLFDQVFAGPTWLAWRAWTCAVYGLPMSEAEAAIFRACTGRTTLPTAPCREVWTIAGRRSGKTRMSGFTADAAAAIRKYTLAPGEQGRVPIISPSRAQGRPALNYAVAMLKAEPALEKLITRETADAVDLTAVSIEIQSASFRTPRGFTNVGAILDEVAFWRDDSGANPDVEILRALRPSLASVPDSLLVAISSPYAARGELFKTYERHFGKDGSDVLVWQADTRTMNPTIPQRLIDQALDEDPASASAEWLGQFRSDLESLFARAALDAVTVQGRFELAPAPGVAYVGFVDPSGGSADSFTLSIAHRDPAGALVLDLVRECRPPFSPEGVTAEFARDLKRYNVTTVTGDRYAGEWPREQFRKCGIAYQPSELTRSELFLELLPLVNSGALELLDHPRLLGQLAGLERRVGRAGKDAIDHRAGSHDDVANSAGGALVMAVRSVGLKASFPTDFTSCRVWNACTWAAGCFLLGGSLVPDDPVCRKHCSGYKAVRAGFDAYAVRTAPEDQLHIVEWTKQNFKPNTFTANVIWARAEQALGL